LGKSIGSAENTTDEIHISMRIDSLHGRRRTGNDIDPATMGWTKVMASCILAEQPFDFIP